MKLLGVGMTTHDNNVSYFDGKNIKYCKFERTKQEKHFGFDNPWEWIREVEKMWNFKIEEIDEIGIDFDAFAYSDKAEEYNKILKNESLYYVVSDNLNPFKRYGAKNVININHHFAHSLSTWMLEDKQNKPTTRIVIDGIGNDKSFSIFKNNKIIRFGLFRDSSIGYEMDLAGGWLGVKSSNSLDNAGKVMGLQSYGKIDEGFLRELSQYSIDQVKEIFNIKNWEKYKNDELLARLTPLDWIKTVHENVGNLLVNIFNEYVEPEEIISYSGGVAQNVVWNTKLKENFKNIIIPPHSGDEGTSLGIIEFLRIKNNLNNFEINNFPYIQNDESPTDYPSEQTIKFAAKCLSEGKIIGWYQGNGEIGPRALGNRSILMDPRIKNGKELINKIKKRENYRPFGASILNEYCYQYFDTTYEDKYMLFTKNFILNDFPAITHVDNTCRVQTVEKNFSNFRKLIEEFYNLTECPIILNTSLNVNGKPIAGYKENAIHLFESTNIDCMFIGNEILLK